MLAGPVTDPYFARRLGGRRVLELPDIAEYLPPENRETPPPAAGE